LGAVCSDAPCASRPRAPPRNLRLTPEELGAAFVNLGQLAAARGDLLGPR
jgi:predicted unusual protein kinase regulating ubiquinone biosynthesis (AarF/ABC1/UbiB family)